MKDLKKEIKYLDGLSDCCGARVFLRTKSKYKLCEKCGVHCRITLSQPEKKEEFRQVTKNLKNEIETTPLKEHIKEDEDRLKELLGKRGRKPTKADINSILVDDYEREMNK